MLTPQLSRRERELMDIVHRLGRATVAEVRAEMMSPPTYSAVRALMCTLETKGHLRHAQEGRAYVYSPSQAPSEARAHALQRVVSAFFGGSAAKAAMALVQLEDLDPDELDGIKAAIARAEEQGQ